MILKILNTASLTNTIRYISRAGAQLIGGHLVGGTAQERAQVMRAACLDGKPPLKHQGAHLILALAPGQHLDPSQWEHAIRTALKGLGMADCLWEAWLHQDKGHEHVHIAVTARTEQGKRVDRRGDRIKAKRICRALEKEFQFPPVNNDSRSARRKQKPSPIDPGVVAVMRRALARHVGVRGGNEVYTFAQLALALRRHGVEMVPKVRDGRVIGLGFCRDGVYIRASELGAAFTFSALKRSGIEWAAARDLPVMRGDTHDATHPIHGGPDGPSPYDFERGWRRSLILAGFESGHARRLARDAQQPGGSGGDPGPSAPGQRPGVAGDERPHRRRNR